MYLDIPHEWKNQEEHHGIDLTIFPSKSNCIILGTLYAIIGFSESFFHLHIHSGFLQIGRYPFAHFLI